MSEESYDYQKTIVIKVIVEDPEGKILLVKEPSTNAWMPGRWGLPGGKPFEKESLREAFKRKTKKELGIDLEPKGIYKIEELLIDKMTVLMIHVVSSYNGEGVLKGYAADFKWVGVEELEQMNIPDFTEYFNKKLLLGYLTGSKKLVNFDIIETQAYYKFYEEEEYKKWFGE